MDNMAIVLIAVIGIIFLVALVGIFKTKTQGFGKYTTSAILLVLVLFITTLAFFLDKIEASVALNLFFAVAGYAGGLLGGREQK